MDNNNMNVVDYNSIGGQTPQPAQVPNMEPNPFATPVQPVEQTVPMPEVGPVPPVEPVPEVQQVPVVEETPVQNNPFQQPIGEINQQPINQNIQMPEVNNQSVPVQEVPTIDVNQTPTEVFGAQVNEQVPDNQNVQNIIPPIGPEEAVQPKYGYMTNEDKPNLNEGSNANITFIIFLAVLMLGFIIALPYISNMLG